MARLKPRPFKTMTFPQPVKPHGNPKQQQKNNGNSKGKMRGFFAALRMTT